MLRTDRRRAAVSGILVCALASCDVASDYVAPRFAAPAKFAGVPAVTSQELSRVAWWETLKDPALNALITQARASNLDLALATERVVQANAEAGTLASQASVSGTLRAGYEGGDGASDSTGADGLLSLSWLFDPWGERKAEKRKLQGQIQVADAERDAAQLLLVSRLVTAYVDLRFNERTLQLRRQELASRRKTLSLVDRLQERRVASRLDVVRAQALVAETRALVPQSESAVRRSKNQIAVLLGKAPWQHKESLKTPGPQPVAVALPPLGAPSDVLRSRPDIRIAERLYYVAVAEADVQRAQLYPTLSLSGTLSLSAFGGPDSSEYFFGPTLRLPATPNGPRKAGLLAQDSRVRQSFTSWKSTVLTALSEVETGLVETQALQKSVQSSRQAVKLYQQTVDLTRQLVESEEASVQALLEAEQDVASANIRLAENLRSLGLSYVRLNVSLGSGSG